MTAGADRADEADPAAPPLLLVAHGSRTAAATAVTEAVADDVRACLPGVDVHLGYVDDASPSVRRALAAATRTGPPGTAGSRTLVVLPLLLTAAAHAKTDIPGALLAGATPGWRLRYGRPLGPQPALFRAVVERVAEAGGGPGTVVVLAAGGSIDPDANAEVARAARLVAEMGPFHAVEPAFVTTAEPSVTTAVRRWTRLAEGPVVVAPYLLTPGFLADRCRRDAGPATVADVVGAHHAVTEVVVERYREALGGDIRMNCDVCMYRTPMPGREHLVGVPQLPHRHPDDQL